MRIRDILEYPRLRRILRDPVTFMRERRARRPDGRYEMALLDGTRLELRRGTRDFHVFHRIFVRDEYGLDALPIAHDSWAIDGGAHIGLFALRVAARGAKVLCIEPAPDNLEVLRRHIRTNHLEERVRVCAKALASSTGVVRLSAAGDPYAYAVAPVGAGSGGGVGVTVESVTLAELLAEHGIAEVSLLKLDVEGSEYDVLERGSAEAIARCARVRLELHAGDAPDAPHRLKGHLEGSGFIVERFAVKRGGRQGYLFCRRDE